MVDFGGQSAPVLCRADVLKSNPNRQSMLCSQKHCRFWEQREEEFGGRGACRRNGWRRSARCESARGGVRSDARATWPGFGRCRASSV
jgi:hypothetical protein